MTHCATCRAELEPPVRTPHTVYVKTLYRIAVRDYCRHHIIKAAVAAGVIAEVRPGAEVRQALGNGPDPDGFLELFSPH